MIKLIKSYKFWTSLAGGVGMVVTLLSEHIGINISADGAKEIIMAICGLLITLGIVKKPEGKKNTNLAKSENVNDKNEQTNQHLGNPCSKDDTKGK